ncbi:IS481 family transposase, partial [Amaricoccus sp. HAR-UPW-R2A-40]
QILKGLTPYEFIFKRWTIEPERFIVDPIHQMPGIKQLGCEETIGTVPR